MLEQRFLSSLATSLGTIAFTVTTIALIEAAGTGAAATTTVAEEPGCHVEFLAPAPPPGWLLLLDDERCLHGRGGAWH
jgi:hypothetical protein